MKPRLSQDRVSQVTNFLINTNGVMPLDLLEDM